MYKRLLLFVLRGAPLYPGFHLRRYGGRGDRGASEQLDHYPLAIPARRKATQGRSAAGPHALRRELAQGEKDVLRGLIDRQLLLEKGKELGITADTEIIKRLDEIRKQMKLASLDDLEKAAAAQGVSFEDYKQNMKVEIITQQVIQREIGPHINVTNPEMRKFYEEHKAELARPEAVRLSEILVSTDEAGTDEQKLAAAKAKAEDLLKQIRSGANFEDIAKKESQDPSAAEAGDLGYFERGKLAKQLEDVTFAMKKGDVSDVVRTKQGFVILKVIDHQAGGIPAYSEIESRVQEAVYMRSNAAQTARISKEAARRGVYRYQAGLCRYGRQQQSN